MNRWRVCTLGQTEIYVHPALLLYVSYALLTGHLTFIIVAMLSILLHETAHAVVSSLCGFPPRSLEITPLGAVMHLEDDSRIPVLRRAAVILAGPAMTLLLCWAAVQGQKAGVFGMSTGRLLFLANLSIVILNLLPVLPLDGGRLLAILLGCLGSQRSVYRILRLLGYCLGISLIALNLWCSWRMGGWNLSLAFAGCCVLYSTTAAATTRAMAELRSFMDRKILLERRGSRKTVCITCLHTETVACLVRKLPAGRNAVFLCLEAGSMRLMGWIDEYRLVQYYLQNPAGKISGCLLEKCTKADTNLAQSEKETALNALTIKAYS